jgi:broad specificity phosphatase PhoE
MLQQPAGNKNIKKNDLLYFKKVNMRYLLLLLPILFAVNAGAQLAGPLNKKTAIYIVRHGEKQSGDDPVLTEEGNKRAGDLMRLLKDKNIRRIYVSEFKRTQHTADSLLLQLGIDTVQINADSNCIALFEAIKKQHDWGRSILIISHSNIIPKIIYKLGVTGFPQENTPATEFDNVYIVRYKNKKAVLEHLKYGKASVPSAVMH